MNEPQQVVLLIGSPRGVVANVEDCVIVVIKFEFRLPLG